MTTETETQIDLSALSYRVVRRRHEELSDSFSLAMRAGTERDLVEWAELTAFQAEHAMRQPRHILLQSAGPQAVHYEVVHGDDPIRLSFTVLCF